MNSVKHIVFDKPKKDHFHRFLSPDYGHPKLREHIASLIALGRASGHNWNNFKRNVERAFPRFGDNFKLDLPLSDEEA